jgi:membrane protein
MKLREWFGVFKEAARDFKKDDAMSYGAGLAFYTALSLSPLVVLLMWIAGSLGESTQQQLMSEVMGLVGAQAGEAVKTVAESAESKPSIGNVAGLASIAVLIFSATGVFAQLQHALNVIWEVEPKPGGGIKSFLRTRLLSLGMLATIGFLLLVSLLVSTVLSAAIGAFGNALPGADILWRLVELGASILIFTLIFGAIFKVLPDVKIGWRNVVVGALITAVLFTIGKTLIGIYLGRSSMASAYGAAGSLLVLLVWVYYSSLILFFGAEVTQVWASRHGSEIAPDEHAKWRQIPRTA